MNKIAIIGAGYAGLATCWNLLPKHDVTVFAEPPCASAMSTGLLHPYPGEHARRSWEAEKAMAATRELLDIAQKHVSEPVYLATGVFRPALIDKQKESFPKALQYPDVEWREGGLFIKSGLTVFTSRYLQGLKLACKKATFIQRTIHSLDELKDFDRIIIAAGAGCLAFPECKELPLTFTKGQALLCKGNIDLPYSLCAKGHIVPAPEKGYYMIGSTYERDYTSLEPDLTKAMPLLDLITSFYPPAKDLQVVSCHAALRIAQRGDYRPLVKRINERIWVFTGLGSRGLLYHAFSVGKLLEKDPFQEI